MSSQEVERTRRLVRPSLETKFHIDYEWWDRADRDLEVYLRSHLCSDHQERFGDLDEGAEVDFVDPETAVVTRVGGIEHVLISHCSRQEDYITPQTSLINAVFRVFSANGNQPLSSDELGERLNRPPRTILRTLSGPRVYKGIRPILDA
jgi:hypothetical protein